jgi:HSP20 family molecular chaperone IbpA
MMLDQQVFKTSRGTVERAEPGGERKVEEEVKENGFRSVERIHRSFRRRFSLPDYATAYLR